MSFWDLFEEMDHEFQKEPEILQTLVEQFTETCNPNPNPSPRVSNLNVRVSNPNPNHHTKLKGSMNQHQLSAKKLLVFHQFLTKSPAGLTLSHDQLTSIFSVCLARILQIQEDHENLNVQILLKIVNLMPIGLVLGREPVHHHACKAVISTYLNSIFQSITSKISDDPQDRDHLESQQCDFLESIRVPLILFRESIHKTTYLNEILTWFQFFFNHSSKQILSLTFQSWKYLILNIACDGTYLVRKVDLLLIPIWNFVKFSKSLVTLTDPTNGAVAHSFLYLLRVLDFVFKSTGGKIDVISRLVAPLIEESSSKIFQSQLIPHLLPFFCPSLPHPSPQDPVQTLADTWTKATTFACIQGPAEWTHTHTKLCLSLFHKSWQGGGADTWLLLLRALLLRVSVAPDEVDVVSAAIVQVVKTMPSSLGVYETLRCVFVDDDLDRNVCGGILDALDDVMCSKTKNKKVCVSISPRRPHFKEWSQTKVDERMYLSSIAQSSDLFMGDGGRCGDGKENGKMRLDVISPHVLSKKRRIEETVSTKMVEVVEMTEAKETAVITLPETAVKTSPEIDVKTAKETAVMTSPEMEVMTVKEMDVEETKKEKDLISVLEKAVGLIDQVDDLSHIDLTHLQSHLSTLMARVCKRLL